MTTAAVANAFIMYGARGAMYRGLTHIAEQVNAIEKAVVENPSLAFDLSKALVESACKTILTERAIAFASNDDLPKLYKSVLSNLPLLPAQASNEVAARRSIARTLGGLQGALQGVCELRSNYGFTSHGGDGSRARMETIQALLAAQAADTIVGFLYRIHRSDTEPRSGIRREYRDNSEFNDYVDDSHDPVRIFRFEYRPSEVLFVVDPDAYVEALDNYMEQANEADRSESEN